jgi:eukaryotic-like serine/threonine-protein kinase
MESSAELAWGWDPDYRSQAGSDDPDVTLSPLAVPALTTGDAPTIARNMRREASEFSLRLDPHSCSGGLPSASGPDDSDDGPVRFPSVGEVVGGFQLLKMLGRGSFAHVYLAEQSDLANRLVALKVSKAVGDEPDLLAQLQHTHIVPIHSVHTDRDTGLRLLCMPYFGGANLAEILRTTGANLPSLATGRSLVDALDRIGGQAPQSLNSFPSRTRSQSRVRSRSRSRQRSRSIDGRGEAASEGRLGRAATRGLGSPSVVRSLWGRYLARLSWTDRFQPDQDDDDLDGTEQPARKYLRSHSYVEAAVWIAARLAEGLEHAHERGILHRDLKPSNILIAADGTPMLLDFNLSADIDPAASGRADANALGGTLPYMAPEHLDAFNPLGATKVEAVDERSDLYSLGLILFEMVAGHHPFADPPEGLRMTEVLRRMIEERRQGAPSARASNPAVPWSVESILRRCLAPEPEDRYQMASELAEDLQRFLDDLPLRYAPELSLRERAAKWGRRHPGACSAASIGGVGLASLFLVCAAVLLLRDGLLAASARVQRQEFRDTFTQCQLLLNTSSGPVDHLGPGLEFADKALAGYQVGKPGVNWLKAPAIRRLKRDEQLRLREEIAELLMLVSRATITLKERTRSEPQRRKALQDGVGRLTLAERIDPHPSPALYTDRARYFKALGEADRAAKDRRRAEKMKPQTARDLYLMGTSHLVEKDYQRAEAMLSRAVTIDSQRFWAWFTLGLCHFDQRRYLDAAGDFGVCTALAPEFAWPHLDRGLALSTAGQLVAARASYDRALQANPRFAEARVNRGLVRLELNDPAGALEDLDRAIQLGRKSDPAILLARAESLARLGRRAEALAEFAETLRVRPDDPAALVARGFLTIWDESAKAESDFRHVLSLDSGQGRSPHQARAHLGMAILLKPKDLKAALVEAETALQIDPNFLDALQFRGLLRARLGQLSAIDDVDRLLLTPTAHRYYNAACALSVLSKTTGDVRYLPRAIELLQNAVEAGFDRSQIIKDPDLEPLRNFREFNAIARLME